MNASLAKICSDWWAERFEIDEKREAFRAELARRLVADEISDHDRRGFGITLYVDYDPMGTLLEIVHLIGIECRGFLFSADGILPCKRDMTIRPDGSVEVRDGLVQSEWLVPRAEIVE
jgi:hypothetical protein